MDGQHEWDDGPVRERPEGTVIGEWLFSSMTRLNAALPDNARFTSGSKPEGMRRQRDLMQLINKVRRDGMLASSGVWDKARLEATAAKHAGAWLDAPPNIALDFQSSNAEVQYGVGRRLGVELCQEGPCQFCLGVMDRWGLIAKYAWREGIKR